MKTWKVFSAAVLASGLMAQAAPPQASAITQLQKLWLECDRLASTTLVDPGTAADCSRVHEQLLQRGFDGDFRRMLAWWQANRSTAQSAPKDRTVRRP
jgi:hypothetical protein